MQIAKKTEYQLFFIYHTVITVVLSIFAYLLLEDLSFKNFMLGQIMSWLSLASLAFSIYLFFLKKSIALLIALIVLKWPILIYVLLKLTRMVVLEPVWLSIGFLPIFLSALVWSTFHKG